MATIGEILDAAKRTGPAQPWDAGQGVVPDQPVQAPIDPNALALSIGTPTPAPVVVSIADQPLAEAQRLAERQGAAAQLAAPQSSALQSSPLGLLAIGALLGDLLGIHPATQRR